MRNEVFNKFNPDGIGMDMLAVDTARGRDHGLSPYHAYLELSTNGTIVVREWNDLAVVFSAQSIDKLQQMYESVFDIDLLVGLLLEKKAGVYTGPVGQYIIEEQFYRFKYGDRFFYSLVDNPWPFSSCMLLDGSECGSQFNYLCVFAYMFPCSPNRRDQSAKVRQCAVHRWRNRRGVRALHGGRVRGKSARALRYDQVIRCGSIPKIKRGL